MTTEEKFWSKVNKTESCWLWTGSKMDRGYGIFSNKIYDTRLAHRISLMIIGMPVPKTLVVDHICRNKSCVNPTHLRLVTQAENVFENSIGVAQAHAKKTHCHRGHIFDKENTSTYVNKKTGKPTRVCKKCNVIDTIQHRNKKTNPRTHEEK